MNTGDLHLAHVPTPDPGPHQVLVQTTRSLVSPGTERMLTSFAQASLLDKARQQPHRVRQALDKARTDGVMTTYRAIQAKLGQPLPLGYSQVGVVRAVGPGVRDLRVGDRVASNGPHAELAVVPERLCARVPDAVSDDHAAFTVLGSIALQGIRLVQPTFGETVVVTGLGLLGLLATRLLVASGVRVIALDLEPTRVALARASGADARCVTEDFDPVATVLQATQGLGADAVLITASSSSNALIQQAARMSRQRGRVVLVGVVGLDLDRDAFYAKELTFQVSCSYGPGRYDPGYEEEGRDYPPGFVRWTAQRNFQAVLESLAAARLQVDDLLSARVPFERYQDAYARLDDPETLGIALEYPEDVSEPPVTFTPWRGRRQPLAPSLAVIGAGNYARATLLPALRQTPARLAWVASRGGVQAATLRETFAIERATADPDEALSDPDVHGVVIATRHDSHADLTIRALRAGKHVLVEKPLALSLEQLEAIAEAHTEACAAHGRELILTVGFNRRFSPLVRELLPVLRASAGPLSLNYTVNAGALPPTHWTHDPQQGGGRILGEAVHIVDLALHLTGAPIEAAHAVFAGPHQGAQTRDNASIVLRHADGSIAHVGYHPTGSSKHPKEHATLHVGGRTAVLDNYRTLTVSGPGRTRTHRARGADAKGHVSMCRAFVDAMRVGGPSPIPLSELLEVHRATLSLVRP